MNQSIIIGICTALFLLVSFSVFNDKVFGKTTGCNSISCSGTVENDIVSGSDNSDYISAGDGSDTVYGLGGNDNLVGGNGSDVLYGGAGNDNITGGNGIDRLYGGHGNDTLVGGSSADLIVGGEGDDKIISSNNLTGESDYSDGSKDIISCGPGHDEVWLSIIKDGDTMQDCEVAH